MPVAQLRQGALGDLGSPWGSVGISEMEEDRPINMSSGMTLCIHPLVLPDKDGAAIELLHGR